MQQFDSTLTTNSQICWLNKLLKFYPKDLDLLHTKKRCLPNLKSTWSLGKAQGPKGSNLAPKQTLQTTVMQKLSFLNTVSGRIQFLRGISFLGGSLIFILMPCSRRYSLFLVSQVASSGMAAVLRQLLLTTKLSMRLLQMETRRGQKLGPRFRLTVLQGSPFLANFDLNDSEKGIFYVSLIAFFIEIKFIIIFCFGVGYL